MLAAMGKAKTEMKAKMRDLQTSVKPKAQKVKASLCSATFCVQAVKTVALVLFYYVFSIGLTFYNQRLIHVSIAPN